MLSGDHSVQGERQRHHLIHHPVCFLQHQVVVRVDRNIGVHIAITGMHVQRYKQPGIANSRMNPVELLPHRPHLLAIEDLPQRGRHLPAVTVD